MLQHYDKDSGHTHGLVSLASDLDSRKLLWPSPTLLHWGSLLHRVLRASKQGRNCRSKTSRGPVALLMPLCAQAQTPDRCVPAVMSFSIAGETDVAVLDMHGQWHVSSWEGVTWIALHAPEEKARCIDWELLLGSAETACTGVDWRSVTRIVSTDPLASGFANSGARFDDRRELRLGPSASPRQASLAN
jgi:hypothetical protein